MEAMKGIIWGVLGQGLCVLLLSAVSYLPPPEHKQLVVQGSDDCAWCVRMEREIQKELAGSGKYSLATDTSGESARATAQIFLTHKHSARVVPALLITRNGKVVWRHTGYLSVKKLVAEYERH